MFGYNAPNNPSITAPLSELYCATGLSQCKASIAFYKGGVNIVDNFLLKAVWWVTVSLRSI
jgi:hypothetical protein